MPYGLAVDLGTTWTGAAIADGERVTPVMLASHEMLVPSLVHLDDAGDWSFGVAAQRRAATEPDGLARAFKRSFGDPIPQILSGRQVTAGELTGRLLTWVVESVSRERGESPHTVVVTHPAHWSPSQRELLRSSCAGAVGSAGLGLLTEPEAIAVHFATSQQRPAGHLVVYDFGGGTFDATVLATTATGFRVVGEPVGRASTGGIDLDDLVVEWALDQLDEATRARLDRTDPLVVAGLRRLRAEAVSAKETLSSEARAPVRLSLPTVQDELQLLRSEFEDLARPLIDTTIEAVGEAAAKAGITTDQIDLILLAGGSSQVPLVSERLASRLGIETSTAVHPKLSVALGAAATTLPEGPSLAPVQPPEPVVAATAASDPPQAEALPEVDPESTAGSDGGDRARWPLMLGVMAAAAALVGLIAWGLSSDGGSIRTPPTEVTGIALVATHDVEMGLWTPISVGSDLWIPHQGGVTVFDTDDATQTRVEFPGSSETPLEADGQIWVPNIDPEHPTLTVLAAADPSAPLEQVEVGRQGFLPVELGGFVWVPNRADGTVSRVDMVSLDVLTIEVGPGLGQLFVLDGEIRTAAGSGSVVISVDGSVRPADDPRPLPVEIDGEVFRVADDGEAVLRLPAGEQAPAATIPTGPGTRSLTVSGEWIWAFTDAGFVRIDVETDTVSGEPIAVDPSGGLTATDDGLWIAERGDEPAVHFIESDTMIHVSFPMASAPDAPVVVGDRAYAVQIGGESGEMLELALETETEAGEAGG